MSIIKLVNFPHRLLALLFLRTQIPAFVTLSSAAILLLLSGYLAAMVNVNLIYAGIVFFIANQVNQAADYLISIDGDLHPTGKNIIRILRYSGYTVFFSACGIAGYIDSNSGTYLIAVCFMVFMWVYLTLLLTGFVSSNGPNIEALVKSEAINSVRSRPGHKWEKNILSLHPIVRFEYVPIIVLLISAINVPGILFWASALLLTGTIIIILRLLTHQDTDDARQLRHSVTAFVFYLVGATILLYLVLRLPLSDLMEVVNIIGPEVLWLIIFPCVWAIPHAMTLMVLLDNRISFRDALYTQISGDGFNGITPLLGMGGEPYKARHLSRFVPLQDSSRAIVQSRLIHAISGVLFTVVILLLCLLTIDLSSLPGLELGIWLVTLTMAMVIIVLIWVTMSKVPTQFTGFILSKFKLIEEFRHDPLTWSKLCIATAYRLAGRCGKFLELYIIFLFIDILPKFTDVLLAQGMILASVSVFFFVPQGLGVNELGIAAALKIAGYSAATGVVFGLIRRARMIVYALLGLIVYAVGTFLYAHKK
jgi:hypothetical protein